MKTIVTERTSLRKFRIVFLAIVCILFLYPSFARATLYFFGRGDHNAPVTSNASNPGPSAPPAAPPKPPAYLVQDIQSATQPLAGSVSFGALANVQAPPATNTPQAVIATSGPDTKGKGGVIVASSAKQVAFFQRGAADALGVAQALIGGNSMPHSSNDLPREIETAEIQLPPNVWPHGSRFDAKYDGKLNFAPFNATPLYASTETERSDALQNERKAQWQDLDRMALEYAYALQFVGYGLIHHDGPVFVTWAIAHGIRVSNKINNAVIDELEALSVYPQSRLRDDKIHSLLAYLKNPTLKELRQWLGELGGSVLDQQTSE